MKWGSLLWLRVFLLNIMPATYSMEVHNFVTDILLSRALEGNILKKLLLICFNGHLSQIVKGRGMYPIFSRGHATGSKRLQSKYAIQSCTLLILFTHFNFKYFFCGSQSR